jgi:Putative stress-induced transcription regulator
MPGPGSLRLVPARPARYYRTVTTVNHSVASSSPLDLLQSFAGTLTAGPGSSDVLATRETAIPWLRANGLMPADAVLSGSEHGALLRLRDALRETLTAGGNAAPGSAAPGSAAPGGRTEYPPVPSGSAERLTKALADGRLVVTIEPADGSVKLATAARSVYPSIVAAIAVSIAQADAAGSWLQA